MKTIKVVENGCGLEINNGSSKTIFDYSISLQREYMRAGYTMLFWYLKFCKYINSSDQRTVFYPL